MVFIEKKMDYLSTINKIPKMAAFRNLLLNDTIILPPKQDLSETEEIYFEIVNAIQTINKDKFENYYNKKQRSKPSKESPSPFVNDDFLIFCLIVGIEKFGLDKTWINYIISIRPRNLITITFENILNENYCSKNNLFEIIIIYLQLSNKAIISNEFLNSTFRNISNNIELFECKSDFQIICAIRSYDLIIELKESPDGSEMSLLKKFNSKFQQRIKFIALLIQIVILTSFLYACMKLLSYDPQIKELFDKFNPIFTVMGFLGLGSSSLLIPAIKKNLYEILLRILGYPKELIKHEDK